MKFILDLVDRLSGPGRQAAASGTALAGSLTSAAGASAALDGATSSNATSIREMYGELSKTEAELKRYEAAQKRLATGGAVDVAQWRILQGEINKAKGKIGVLNQSIVQAGGANFDVKKYDAEVKAKESAEKAKGKVEGKGREESKKGDEKATKDKGDKAKQSFAALGSAGKDAAKIALAAIGADALGAVLKIGLGFQGVARLNGILARAQYNFRGLFKGTDSKPMLDSLDRLVGMLSPASKTGAALGTILRGSFDGLGKAIEFVTPFAERFFAGLILGGKLARLAFTYIEIGVLKTLAFIPGAAAVVTRFGTGWGPIATGAIVAAGALGVLAVKAAIVAGPFILAAIAITAVSEALRQLSELVDQWDENSLNQIGSKLAKDFGVKGADALDTQRQGITTGDAYDKKYGLGKYAKPATEGTAGPAPKPEATKAAGVPVGEALGAGMVQGMSNAEKAVEAAGAGLAKAAETGARKEGEIRSPSGKMRRRVGWELGAGVVVGVGDMRGEVQKAAEDALIPDIGGTASGGGTPTGKATLGQGGGNGRAVYIDARGATFYGLESASGFVRMVKSALADEVEEIREQIGAMAEAT